jgi:hypothetical protein
MQPSPPSSEPEGILDGLNWRAIALGALVDVTISFVAVVPMGLWFAGADAFSDEDASARAIEAVSASPEFLLASLLVGLGATAYGGYFAARRAGVSHLRHGGWVAVVSATIGFLSLLLPGANTGPQPPAWYGVLGLVLMIPAGVLGGFIALKR